MFNLIIYKLTKQGPVIHVLHPALLVNIMKLLSDQSSSTVLLALFRNATLVAAIASDNR